MGRGEIGCSAAVGANGGAVPRRGIYGNGLNGMNERGVRYTERMAGARIVQADKRAWTDVALAGDEMKERDAL